LIALSAAVGAIMGAAGWFAFDGGRPMQARLQAETAQARSIGLQLRGELAPTASTAGVVAGAPLFALTSGPGAVTEPAVQLLGLSITPRRQAALVSINAKPAQWLNLGETLDGVTLVQVSSTRVLVDTPVAIREAALWTGPVGKTGQLPSGGAKP